MTSMKRNTDAPNPSAHPNPVVTFLPIEGNSVLMYRRPSDERNYPDMWAFPGGKVEYGETFIDTLVRELLEETGLQPAGTVAFLDTYCFGGSVGVAFAVHVRSRAVTMENSAEHKWVGILSEFSALRRVPGIDNHFVNAQMAMSSPHQWASISDYNLIEASYLNH